MIARIHIVRKYSLQFCLLIFSVTVEILEYFPGKMFEIFQILVKLDESEAKRANKS